MIFDDNGRITQEGFEKLKSLANNDLNPIFYLSIDPGKSNGITGYDAKCYLQFMWTIHEADLVEFLECFKRTSLTVIESYRVYSHKATQHVNSDLITSRVIGRVEHWAESNGITLMPQAASVKTTGYKWAGKKPLPKSNPMNHALDAHVHFIYFAVKRGLLNAADLLKKK